MKKEKFELHADKVYAHSIVGLKKGFPRSVENMGCVGYFLLTTHPVYGVTYAVTDNDGALLKRGYVPSEVADNEVEGEFLKIAKQYGLFSNFRDLEFAPKTDLSYAPFYFPSDGIVPLSVITAATSAPFGGNMEGCARDLADISPEEWNAERRFVRDGNTVNICGGHDAAGYTFTVEGVEKGKLVLRSIAGAPRDVVMTICEDEYVTARAYIEVSGDQSQIALTPRDAKKLGKIMRSLSKRK